jgi:hypothetical protein
MALVTRDRGRDKTGSTICGRAIIWSTSSHNDFLLGRLRNAHCPHTERAANKVFISCPERRWLIGRKSAHHSCVRIRLADRA